jgi:transcriptional regulator with XRE-family HTH domain
MNRKWKKRRHTLDATPATYSALVTGRIREELTAARLALGLSQNELAKLLGVPRQVIGNWEQPNASVRLRKSTVEKWRRGLAVANDAAKHRPARAAKLRAQPAASAKPRRTNSRPKATTGAPRPAAKPAATPESSTDPFLLVMVTLSALLALFVAVASLSIILS